MCSYDQILQSFFDELVRLDVDGSLPVNLRAVTSRLCLVFVFITISSSVHSGPFRRHMLTGTSAKDVQAIKIK